MKTSQKFMYWKIGVLFGKFWKKYLQTLTGGLLIVNECKWRSVNVAEPGVIQAPFLDSQFSENVDIDLKRFNVMQKEGFCNIGESLSGRRTLSAVHSCLSHVRSKNKEARSKVPTQFFLMLENSFVSDKWL